MVKSVSEIEIQLQLTKHLLSPAAGGEIFWRQPMCGKSITNVGILKLQIVSADRYKTLV